VGLGWAEASVEPSTRGDKYRINQVDYSQKIPEKVNLCLKTLLDLKIKKAYLFNLSIFVYLYISYIYKYIYKYINVNMHLLSPWAGVTPWGNPGFCSSPSSTPEGFGVPGKTEGCWGEQAGVGISTLASSMGSPWESRNPSLLGCAVPVAKQVKMKQAKTHGIRNKDLWDMK